MTTPSQERLSELFQYNHDGTLTRLCNVSSCHKAGEIVHGTKQGNGYRKIYVDSKNYWMHRIIWKLVNGFDSKTLDHINGNRDDNRIENLRCVTKSQNAYNITVKPCSASGYYGVYRSRTNKTVNKNWRAMISNESVRNKIIGYFTDKESACVAWCKEAKILQGKYAKIKIQHNLTTMIERGFDPKDYGWE